MRVLPIAACALIALFAAAPASASFATVTSGPFVGTATQGSSDAFQYASHPPGTECLAIYQPHVYTVRLEYAPPTDALTLSVGGLSDVGANGIASVSFIANYCTGFDVQVTGTSVADTAAYLVTVTSVREAPAILCCMS